MKLSNSNKNLTLALFTALSLVSCNLPLQTNNSKELSGTYRQYQSNLPVQIQDSNSLNILKPADFEILDPYNTKAIISPTSTVNTAQCSSGTVGCSTAVKINSVTYTLRYEFLRKLRLILAAATIPNMLLAADFTKLTSNVVVGTSANITPTTSEIAFANLLKTMDSVVMPNLLQGFNTGSEVNNTSATSAATGNPTTTLSFIVNAKTPAIRESFYDAIYSQVKTGDDTPAILTASESNTLKAATYLPGATLPNVTELAFLNSLTAKITVPGIVLLDSSQSPKVQPALTFTIGFVESQVPGAYSAGSQTALNMIQNTGMTNYLLPASTNNYAGAAVALGAKLLLQPNNNINPSSVNTFNSFYTNTLGLGTPASPVTFNNLHLAIRKIYNDNTTASSLKFSYLGSGPVLTSGLGKALVEAGFGTQTLLAKGSVASNQNTTAINNWLNDSSNTVNSDTLRAIVVECSRDSKGVVSFSSSTTNHTVLVKSELAGSGCNAYNQLYIYDPGMPNNPDAPSGTPNYRPMTNLEILALNASVNRLVGITSTIPTQNAVTGEFQVNSITQQDQSFPKIAMNASGNFVITWESNTDGDGFGIYARRYNATGVPQGYDFKVNTTTKDEQLAPAAAMDSTGDFVIAWQSAGQDGNGYGIYAQRYNAAGTAQGAEFKVSTYTNNNQTNPSVAMDSAGDFVVSWESYGQDGNGYGIYAQRYNASGVAQGAEFKVNTFITSNQITPSAAMDSTGDFIIAWDSYQTGNGFGIYAQRYNASGTAQGAEFKVNSTTVFNNAGFPSIGMDSTGDFVIAWESYQSGYASEISAQRYNASGTAQGAEFKVNTTTNAGQGNPSVAMDSAGDFVVSWESYGQDGDRYGIYAQRYNASGTAQGAELQVNTYTNNNQVNSSAAIDSSGNFVIGWDSNGQDGCYDGIFAQRYNASGTAL